MFASRIDKIKPFRVMQVLQRACDIENEGHRVVHFEVGEPDFDTAAPIVRAGQQALLDGRTKYTPANGIAELRSRISQYYEQSGVHVDPQRIFITSGASGGLTLLSALLLDPGDEMLITDPGYPCNEVFIRLTGGVPRALTTGVNQDFQPTAADVEAAWQPATKGVLLASPANPTGTMLQAQQIVDIADYVRSKKGFFVLDEIYQGLTQHAGYRSGLELVDDLFILNSFSKYFGMTGWRLGWLVVPQAAQEAVTKLAQNLFISPSSLAQYAAIDAFGDEAMQIHAKRAEEFLQRARLLEEGLRKLGFVVPVPPQGAFYLYVDISHTGMHSRDFCFRLLDEFHVASTPGEDFGSHQSERYVRFAFTTDIESIKLGLERIGDALAVWEVV
ncbi:MAG: aminotransferase class I/II-fold pyridoxal phosphate-dependent enzyme [Gammaproteobacteria bacterium]|nr:aminotransferase class I/II-fold pyridoxal phosphate-dependent enzyme [Gammaproteobacteria bacterium]